MPWERNTVEELRKTFTEEAKIRNNFSELCREYGITRKTGYKWLKRAENHETMSDHSHARKNIENKTSSQTEEKILTIRKENPSWGGKKIRQVLINQGYVNLPSVKTFNNILKRNGYISEEASLAHTPYKRFQKDNCNDMWQSDFKGNFLLIDKSRCYPLDIIDDCSRYCIKISAKTDVLGVIDVFREAFFEYGMPLSVLTDNGWTFRGLHGGYTTFEKWLMNHDVLPIHGKVRHPQTQGKIERFHRTMKDELLKNRQFQNIQEANLAFQEWRDKYNNIRPHAALNMKCPAQVYTKSERTYSDKVSAYEYGGAFKVVKVNSWGYIRFDKFQSYLSETMIGELIELRPSVDDETFVACYRNFKIAEFDVNTGNLKKRIISRL